MSDLEVAGANLSRRAFIGGLVALAAPAVIRTPGLLMPVRSIIPASAEDLKEWVRHEVPNAVQVTFRLVYR